MKQKKIHRTRAGFGMNKSEKHAQNVAWRAAKLRDRAGWRKGLKAYLVTKRDEQKKKKELVGKLVIVPNRKQLRAGMAKDRRARRERRKA